MRELFAVQRARLLDFLSEISVDDMESVLEQAESMFYLVLFTRWAVASVADQAMESK